ncbi:MAG: LLM class F420-dependent oxidoreductase [Gammaproteobacteria bacterium]|mgnify:CR=1 FL=1|jgi:probable F420-dependent oxidoreductase|nr:LLM class F420-dependent oxidoreductase [Gammaproteobacteria bacterium]MBT5684053.1 LLM class F420-dependent oxidoreductase [Gammaproteobacteria bacterium]MBT5725314.1 LLM class F420-dependent oxidoreductase [Gammaproteobacteria bacterium]
MKFGISMFPTDFSAGPAELARAIEDHGFESYWVSEHSHMPLSTEFPLADSVPRDYASMLDPFVALAAAATVTSNIMLGTAICLVPQRDPINCAKEVSSLDLISKGRVLFGIGPGWNEPEMRNHGTDPSRKIQLMRERVEAMKVLWTHEEAEYHGEMEDFDPVWQWPKPVQKPHPPVLIAGAHQGVLKRIVAYGDGWIPYVVPTHTEQTRGRMTSMAELGEYLPRLRELAEKAGRPMPTVTTVGMVPDAETLATFERLGIDRVVLGLTSAPMEEALKQLDKHAASIKAAGGRIG